MSWSDAFKQKLLELGLDDFAGEPSTEQWRQLLDGIEASLGAPVSPVQRRRAATEDLFQSLYPTFDSIAGVLPQAIFLLDARGRVRRTNPIGDGLMERLNLNHSASIMEILADRHGELDPDLKIDLDMVLTEHVEPVEGRLDDIAALPGRGPISYTLSPLTSGGPAVAAVVLHDHTDERRLEEAMDKAAQATGSASADRSNFVANTSHELRTPLNGILGMAQLLGDTPLTTEQREFVDIINSSGESLLALVNDILDFSKMDAGRLELEEVDFDVLEVVEQVFQVLSEKAASQNTEFIVRVEEGVPTLLRGDPGRLRQVLMNIIGNAVKFTQEGEVILTLRSMGMSPHIADLRFDIQDTGIGMAAEVLDTIFQPFSQADGSTTRKYGGTGLGLAICRQVVGMMGGAISANSVPGEGSLFWFTSKFDKQPDTKQPTYRGGSPPALQGRTCLIMESNATQRETLVALVDAMGMSPRPVSSGEEAVKVLGSDGGASVAIVSASTQGENGLEWVERLRTANGSKRLIVVGIGSPSALVRSAPSGSGVVNHTVIKPILPGRLDHVLRGRTPSAASQAVTQPYEIPQEAFLEPEEDPNVDRRTRPLLLVAEDNVVNQKVAERLLDKLGFQCHMVANGELAVEAAMTGRYQAVLMDCQMPVLSGYEAAQEIRRRETGGRLPIIAMTAHAMPEDREKSLSAGMDDHLTKPIRTPELREALKRWVSDQLEETADAPEALSSDADLVLDEDTLQRLRSLEDPGQPSFLKEVFEAFLEDAPGYLATLRSAAEGHDLEAMRRSAHTWKGSSANLGAEAVRARCAVVEDLARRGDESGIPAALAALESAWETTRVRVSELPEMKST